MSGGTGKTITPNEEQRMQISSLVKNMNLKAKKFPRTNGWGYCITYYKDGVEIQSEVAKMANRSRAVVAVNKANSLSNIMLSSSYGGLSTNEVRSCYDCDEVSLLLLH